MFTLAHLSDLHLAPVLRPSLRELATKRFFGYLSWRARRRHIHCRHVVDLMAEDIRRHAPDHVALTGDLVNLALRREFDNAAQWLKRFGPPEWLSVVPGNHDAYVSAPYDEGVGLWADYMRGDLALESLPEQGRFPFVRVRRNIALIGLSTAAPTAPFIASGRLGSVQTEALGKILPILRERGFFRIILIHHPPVPGMNPKRRGLVDAKRLAAIVEQDGVELIVHGHTHHSSVKQLRSRYGRVHVVGVPSASAVAHGGRPSAAWNRYAIRRGKGLWRCTMNTRTYNETSDRFMEWGSVEFDLSARQ